MQQTEWSPPTLGIAALGIGGLILAVEGYDLGDENEGRITSAVGLEGRRLELLGEVGAKGAFGRLVLASAAARAALKRSVTDDPDAGEGLAGAAVALGFTEVEAGRLAAAGHGLNRSLIWAGVT